MTQTISNVLTGVATLEVKSPDTMRAEWSEEFVTEGDYSVKLSKAAAGDYGSTHVQITPSGAAAALTCNEWTNQAAAWGYDYRRSVTAGVAWWIGMECRFSDPDSNSWIDITSTAPVVVGDAIWATRTFAPGADTAYYGGWSELDGSFSNYTPQQMDGLVAACFAAGAGVGCPNQHAETDLTTWVLTRVRLELWETATERQCFVDNIQLEGVTYNLEPGDAETAGIRLSSMFTEVGYTEDGVTVTYTDTSNPIEVEEETFPIDWALDAERAEVTCNMAESSLYNMSIAMGGSELSGSILKLGGGTMKKLSIQVRAINPASHIRAILIPSCVATGAVGMPYTKGAKTVVPVTFQALKTTGHLAVSIVDNAL